METLLVADSFRVRAQGGVAEARGLDLHLDRFARSVRRVGGPHPRAFLRPARAELAAYGAGFPRLELRRSEGGRSELGLSLRPLPELGDTIELRTAGSRAEARVTGDPRVKGPNIARFAELNRELGAEAVLTEGGAVVEGATTSLLWWDDHRLWAAGADARVDSVTERLVLGIAAGQGVVSGLGRPAPGELARHGGWAANALHGIRVATVVDGARTPEPDEDRLARFRDALDLAWRPILG